MEYCCKRLQDLARLIRHLCYKQVANDLENFIENDQSSHLNRNKWASGSILNTIADYIVKAMDVREPF